MLSAKIEQKERIVGRFTGQNNQLKVPYGSELKLSLLIWNDSLDVAEDLTEAQVDFTMKRTLDDPDSVAVLRKTSKNTKAQVILNDSQAVQAARIQAKTGGAEGNTLSVDVSYTETLLTTLNNGGTLDNGAIQATVTDPSGIHVGSVLEIDDSVNPSVILLVSNVVGNDIIFESLTLGVSINDGADVTALAFDLDVKDGGVVTEQFTDLSMQSEDVDNYFVTVLAESSSLVEGVNLGSSSGLGLDIPASITDASLTGGEDPAGGVDLTEPASGKCDVDLVQSDTLLPARQYFYDVWVTRASGQRFQAIMNETLEITRAVLKGE